jgi:hypothetical protein
VNDGSLTNNPDMAIKAMPSMSKIHFFLICIAISFIYNGLCFGCKDSLLLAKVV